MLGIAVIILLPALVICSNNGNIHLLEEEIAEAIRACTHNDSEQIVKRYNRSNRNMSNHYQYPHIDNNKNSNPYHHERRNTSDMMTSNNVTSISDNDLFGYGDEYENQNNTGRTNFGNNNNGTFKRRNKRNEYRLNKNEDDQCLNQCVFANLQVNKCYCHENLRLDNNRGRRPCGNHLNPWKCVDSRGIPREAELWNKIQVDVTSQHSRILLQDQTRSCFQELQTESEDNGCSYSNKLERCLMLHVSDRMKGAGRMKQT